MQIKITFSLFDHFLITKYISQGVFETQYMKTCSAKLCSTYQLCIDELHFLSAFTIFCALPFTHRQIHIFLEEIYMICYFV